GPGDYSYKILQKLFESKICQWLFSRLHPNLALGFGHAWSQSRKKKHHFQAHPFVKKEQEYLWQYCKTEEEKQNHHDYYIFGHRHIPLDLEVTPQARYINIGEWLWSFTYGKCDGNTVQLLKFEE
ncbi:MAG: UDP-2,3-diacylglucosamine diphosphatase, partial [Flammeovirgaceae bacterium]